MQTQTTNATDAVDAGGPSFHPVAVRYLFIRSKKSNDLMTVLLKIPIQQNYIYQTNRNLLITTRIQISQFVRFCHVKANKKYFWNKIIFPFCAKKLKNFVTPKSL